LLLLLPAVTVYGVRSPAAAAAAAAAAATVTVAGSLSPLMLSQMLPLNVLMTSSCMNSFFSRTECNS
jgi:hypothetical protein